MKSRNCQDGSLEEIILALREESSLLSPVHQKRLEFLGEKRDNSTHSEFLQRLDERIELIEFETLTKQLLVGHIFMEESDLEMTRITTAILAELPGGNLDRANRVTQEEGNPGNKWCTNCRTGTHETSQCWGSCFSCGAYGHKAVHCKKPKQDLPTSGGAIKKAGVGETPKLTKAAKKREQKLKKKAEEDRKGRSWAL